MLGHQHSFSVKRMALVLRVSRSGYYDWRKNGSKLSSRALKQQFRDVKIKELFEPTFRTNLMNKFPRILSQGNRE